MKCPVCKSEFAKYEGPGYIKREVCTCGAELTKPLRARDFLLIIGSVIGLWIFMLLMLLMFPSKLWGNIFPFGVYVIVYYFIRIKKSGEYQEKRNNPLKAIIIFIVMVLFFMNILNLSDFGLNLFHWLHKPNLVMEDFTNDLKDIGMTPAGTYAIFYDRKPLGEGDYDFSVKIYDVSTGHLKSVNIGNRVERLASVRVDSAERLLYLLYLSDQIVGLEDSVLTLDLVSGQIFSEEKTSLLPDEAVHPIKLLDKSSNPVDGKYEVDRKNEEFIIVKDKETGKVVERIVGARLHFFAWSEDQKLLFYYYFAPEFNYISMTPNSKKQLYVRHVEE